MHDFFRLHDLWGILGACLFLVLVYLVLKNWVGTQALVTSTINGANNVFKTLQGR